MQEVVCYNCGRIVHISPDAELCSVCGENLRELLHPVYASKYFYDRAAKMAAGSQLLPALQEIDRGLSYQPSSELRLLGAILSKRIGDFEQMRHHVAAIPVDDVLRPEGEWLLRSHQMRQREMREASKMPGAKHTGAFVGDDEEIPVAIQQVHPLIAAKAQPPIAKRRVGYTLVLVLLLVVTVTGGALFARTPQLLTFLRGTDEETAQPAPDLAEPVRQPTQEQAIDTTSPVLVATAAPTLLPTPSPTAPANPDVPSNVVQSDTPSENGPAEVASSTPGVAVGINATHPFDLESYLVQLDRIDLAQLEVSATFQGTVLSLKGIVPTFEARQALLEIAETVPGVTTVSQVDLLLRLPPTYIVQEGDTLWTIAYRLYGDVTMRQRLFDTNRAILPSPDALTVGVELQVPPME
ncbi:MAG: LysM peptidoglycan-binding domain-containing protein [Caldilineaceae bacterium]